MSILKTEAEIVRDEERIMQGKEPTASEDSSNYVGGVPEQFTSWVEDNKARIGRAKQMPYFIRDNYEGGDVEKGLLRGVVGMQHNRVETESKAEQRKQCLVEMQSLLNKKILVIGNGHAMSVGFSKYGNKHLYSDTLGRTNILTKDDLKNIDKLLQDAEFVKKVGLFKERKDDIKRFYYYKAKLRGRTIYLNVAETDTKDKFGKVWHSRFLYSITDSIR